MRGIQVSNEGRGRRARVSSSRSDGEEVRCCEEDGKVKAVSVGVVVSCEDIEEAITDVDVVVETVVGVVRGTTICDGVDEARVVAVGAGVDVVVDGDVAAVANFLGKVAVGAGVVAVVDVGVAVVVALVVVALIF
ncbi:hypothetical protein CBR_g25834 [Chara braunii]|uniref:Uncharacterized protein n=1 Tax=Chara braunii TaxID=69332 RepID=A0A388L6N1_CHABU|nr:hypothetical protein CBR_g25834 [Chara braunii]|eukprot:GBG77902.1 hypothetical protein CBR_g25834 [Chara braunii]